MGLPEDVVQEILKHLPLKQQLSIACHNAKLANRLLNTELTNYQKIFRKHDTLEYKIKRIYLIYNEYINRFNKLVSETRDRNCGYNTGHFHFFKYDCGKFSLYTVRVILTFEQTIYKDFIKITNYRILNANRNRSISTATHDYGTKLEQVLDDIFLKLYPYKTE